VCVKYFRVQSAVFNGVQIQSVEVECVQSRRLPHLQLLGCTSTASLEMRERLIAAFSSSKLSFPARRITIRLSPSVSADVCETLDLAVALAILGSSGAFPIEKLEQMLVFGSLRLDGAIQEANAAQVLRKFLRNSKMTGAILPWSVSSLLAEEKSYKGGGFRDLNEVLIFLRSEEKRAAHAAAICVDSPQAEPLENAIDRIEGLVVAKRMLEIAAAGAHHSLLLGPRGVGKSLLARALPSLLPPPNSEQQEELSLLYRVRREKWDGRIPFRAPDLSLSMRQLIGGMRGFGELSLAHGGVLFLDELLERDRESLEALRMPMERGWIAKIEGEQYFPADALIVGAANLCPCGARGDKANRCICSIWEIRRYRRRLSFALADRFDLRLELSPEQNEAQSSGRSYSQVRESILMARELMLRRQNKTNGRLELSECFEKEWQESAMARWRAESTRRGNSLRGSAALAKVALTISDLAAASFVSERHVFEAAHYRGAVEA
jgi:magnesium chelatase family protein